MSKTIDAALAKQLAKLNAQNIEELQLFVEFLLNRQEQKKKKTTHKKEVLSDLETIVISVDEVILDRETLYENRI